MSPISAMSYIGPVSNNMDTTKVTSGRKNTGIGVTDWVVTMVVVIVMLCLCALGCGGDGCVMRLVVKG